MFVLTLTKLQTQNIPNTLHAIVSVDMGNSLLIIFLAGKNIFN